MTFWHGHFDVGTLNFQVFFNYCQVMFKTSTPQPPPEFPLCPELLPTPIHPKEESVMRRDSRMDSKSVC